MMRLGGVVLGIPPLRALLALFTVFVLVAVTDLSVPAVLLGICMVIPIWGVTVLSTVLDVQAIRGSSSRARVSAAWIRWVVGTATALLYIAAVGLVIVGSLVPGLEILALLAAAAAVMASLLPPAGQRLQHRLHREAPPSGAVGLDEVGDWSRSRRASLVGAFILITAWCIALLVAALLLWIAWGEFTGPDRDPVNGLIGVGLSCVILVPAAYAVVRWWRSRGEAADDARSTQRRRAGGAVRD